MIKFEHQKLCYKDQKSNPHSAYTIKTMMDDNGQEFIATS